MTFFAQHWSGCDFEIFTSDEDFKRLCSLKETSINITNHKYEIDWLI